MKKNLTFCLILVMSLSFAQGKKDSEQNKTNTDNVAEGEKKDSLGAKSIKPYNEVITSEAKTNKGLFTVHELNDKFYLEISDTLMDREILLVNRIAKGAAETRSKMGFSGYGGNQYDEKIIFFTKENDRLFIKAKLFSDVSTDTTANGLSRAIINSNELPILASFDIETISPDSTSVVTNITDFLNKENSILSFPDKEKKTFSISNFQADKSYIKSVKAYPTNVEVKTIKSYISEKTGIATFELNNSFVLLPKNPMQPRLFDQRVGFFPVSYNDFDDNPQRVEETVLIKRWRLEPREEDLEKYYRGELVEPKKPIVFYIDPATPKRWVPYLIKGVNDWQVAFEQAGFKNAIYAREVATKDSTWNLEDARHSTIVYMASPVANAMGPSISDPRSGEILESHVYWYHNVMTILHEWYLLQAGHIDTRAQNMLFDEELMGQLIRFVSSHEIGHTLGLAHNFGASSTVPVEKLRDKEWVEKHGHTPSIMDYARFNYVAQPEDNIGSAGIFPRIGDYDKWAIQWGYKRYKGLQDPKEEKLLLNNILLDSLKVNPRLTYGPQLIGVLDPRNQSEDLSDNPMKANTYGIKNLKYIIKKLPEWTREETAGYNSLSEMYKALKEQYVKYIGHVIPFLNTSYWTIKSAEQEGETFAPVPLNQQKEAVAFLNKQLFAEPEWLFNDQIRNNVILPSSSEDMLLGGKFLSYILSNRVVNGIVMNTERFGRDNSISLDEVLNSFEEEIWKELESKTAISLYRRNVQRVYVEQLSTMAINIKGDFNDEAMYTASIQLESLKRKLKRGISRSKDKISRAHLKSLLELAENGSNPLERTETKKSSTSIDGFNGDFLEAIMPMSSQKRFHCFYDYMKEPLQK